MSFRAPLIAVVGATGTGKSQLAVTLAKSFGGEIINADALQMYDGLPITTNKISLEERQGIPHHLLGCIGLLEEPWTVSDFTSRASKIIDEIRARHRVPILVGGTHYYTQSLLFKSTLIGKSDESLSIEEQEQRWPILARPGHEVLEELRRVDPEMAKRWHPDDARKIRRSLEIWLQNGRKASDIYAEQKTLDTDQELGHHEAEVVQDPSEAATDISPLLTESLRYDPLIFWIHTQPEILKDRLDQRVDRMIEAGLLEEVESMRAIASKARKEGYDIDMGKGIWIAIGYKEFSDYVAVLEKGHAEPRSTKALLEEGLDRTRAGTRQYAKRQVRWIRLQLLRKIRHAHASGRLFVLDGTDLGSFVKLVERPALEVTDAFLSGRDLPCPADLSEVARELLAKAVVDLKDVAEPLSRECVECGVTLVTANDWNQHLKSRKHKTYLRKSKEMEKNKAHSHPTTEEA
ncbi:hypothetical protein MMC25_007466 [Agyrium rufum]|nr:hypothetical protein [Agyrium rufum]